ncbi:hypothetical protein [Streptomyces sp. NRRL B-1347]|uniref:hypothetical protein n=1 Tax=Streptomyces sp. NRRL B-1347 TaxID=1476877 RepID=UPI0004C84E68|nr:hypothetical protein [Streptomyces sp. NRRL B-1347]
MSRPDPPDDFTVQIGGVRAEWCATCKAWTKTTGDAQLLTPDGVTALGTWGVCQICEDPEVRQEGRRA